MAPVNFTGCEGRDRRRTFHEIIHTLSNSMSKVHCKIIMPWKFWGIKMVALSLHFRTWNHLNKIRISGKWNFRFACLRFEKCLILNLDNCDLKTGWDQHIFQNWLLLIYIKLTHLFIQSKFSKFRVNFSTKNKPTFLSLVEIIVITHMNNWINSCFLFDAEMFFDYIEI